MAVTGVPHIQGQRQGSPRARRREKSLCSTLPACAHTHVLKQGSPESRSIPMVTLRMELS